MKNTSSVLKNIFFSVPGNAVIWIIRATDKIKFLFIFLFILPQLITAQIITTIAGTGTAGYNGDGIAASSAQLYYPQGLAADAAGNIYVADISNNRIRKINISTGMITTVAGTGTAGFNGDGILATSAQLNGPSAVTIDDSGDMYLTDRSNYRVRKVSFSTGIITTVAGTGTAGFNGDGIPATSAQLNGPNEVSFDAAGNLYIADWFNHRVRKVDKGTGFISTIAGTGTAGYNGDGILASSAQINGPCGILFDLYGNTYFVEYPGCRVRMISLTTGLISTIAGTGTAGYNGDGIPAITAQLGQPAYIRFDGAYNLFIGEGWGRVRMINRITGLISTIAGNGFCGYNGDGILATNAQLCAPYDVYFDKLNCNMYIGDCSNHRIRKITGGFSNCPTAVAPGNLSSCQVLPAISINSSNNNVWVPVYDSTGKIAVSINANGNNLGIVNTSLFTKTGACREDGSNRLYLNRNITITPQTPPSSAVSVRLYMLKAELDSLRTALNSIGQPSGVVSINEVDVFKNNDACTVAGGSLASPLTATPGTYNSDFYLQVSISSFSSFYFANKILTAILPVELRSFTGKRSGLANSLKWQVNCNAQIEFNIERSDDGIHFENIGNMHASAGDCNQPFNFTDNEPFLYRNYYRVRIKKSDGTVSYSSTIFLQRENDRGLQISKLPGIVNGSVIHVQVSSQNPQQFDLVISDIAGRIMQRQFLSVQSGRNYYDVHVSNLAPGIYLLYGAGKEGKTKVVRFVKQ